MIPGRDLPLVFVFAPIELALCVYYLWRILSWSEYVIKECADTRFHCRNGHHVTHVAVAWIDYQKGDAISDSTNACCKSCNQGGADDARPIREWTRSQNVCQWRYQLLTVAVGAIRIIKMFGWEDRIKERVAIKREDELDLIWKRRLMTLWVSLLG